MAAICRLVVGGVTRFSAPTNRASCCVAAPSRLAISPSLSIVTELEFNVQHLPKNAGILFAQLRLFNFVEGIRARERRKTCIITVSEKLANGEEIPIATKETTASRSGWEILNVTHLIEQRRQGIDVRLLVRVRGPFGKVNSYTPSEQKRYIDRMQSLLVVYVQPPSGNSHHHQVSVDDEIWQQLQLDFKQLDEQDQDSIVLSRHERAVDKDRDNGISGDETTEPQMCSLKKLKVRFSDLDMETVLQPKSFLMNECVGTCVGKFLQSFRDEGKALTNHAVMKALLAQKTQTPHRICCVPDDKDMGYIMLLLKHANGSMALQRSEKMIANSCGCR